MPVAGDHRRRSATPGAAMTAPRKTAATKASRVAIAGNLQLARTIFDFSQDELGARCQLHRSHISAIERQELNVGLDTIERVAGAFGLPVYVLLMPRTEAQTLLYEAFLGHAETSR
jgi:transcriptional regulator with XRE-family HTH domain